MSYADGKEEWAALEQGLEGLSPEVHSFPKYLVTELHTDIGWETVHSSTLAPQNVSRIRSDGKIAYNLPVNPGAQVHAPEAGSQKASFLHSHTSRQSRPNL